MSTIVYETIDAAYPVAGVDNDTQGFRDNFTVISTGLQRAKTEITALEGQTVKLTNAASGVVDNDFNESSITDASLNHVTFKLKANQVQDENVTVNVDMSNGHYQVYTLGPSLNSDEIQFSISGWPVRNTNNGVAKLTLHLLGNGNAKEVKIVAANGGAIFKDAAWPTPAAASSDADDAVSLNVESTTRPVIVEFWSYNSGTEVYANYLGTFRKSSDA